MIAHFVFWSVQFPILLTPPHKLKYFFYFKALIVPTICVATVIAMTKKAGGVGEIWNQPYATPSGSARNWVILNNFSSVCGGWYVFLFSSYTISRHIPYLPRFENMGFGPYIS